MASLWLRFSALDRNFKLFLLATLLTGFGIAVDTSVFNNYLKDVYHLGVGQRTLLEFPRELPGFLTYFFLMLLLGLGDLRVAGVANLLAGAGMLALGLIPPVYAVMLGAVFLYSTGQHLYMPLTNSIGMSFAKDDRVGRKLGQIGAVNTAALVTGTLLLMGAFTFFQLSYHVALVLGASCFAAAGLALLAMRPDLKAPKRQVRWLWRREYHRFYILSVVWGARKQIFLTFAPWVLVDVFHMPVTYMAMLVFAVFSLGIVVRPLIGHLIDSRGERFVLAAEAVLLVGVCLLYAAAPSFFSPEIALIVVSVCFVLDQSSSNVGMARATYLRKIAVKPEDVSPTLSLGITLDHIMSISMPLIGGVIWLNAGHNGYQWVFLAGAGIAVLNYFICLGIKTTRKVPGES